MTWHWIVQIPLAAAPWWRDSVCYQIYVRSFADGDGDGVGDLRGVEQRLPYLADLGVDSVWLTPFYPSPQHDHGYDVADYRDVDPLFGTLADFDQMLATAHDLGIRVIVDVVPNHMSSEHAWFVEALASEPGTRARDRFVFRDGRGRDGSRPPNNWKSVFGGPAWTRVDDGQWYLHMFDSSQPDLNWWNDEVGDEFESVLRFWLDRGVDGFRVDVAHGLYTPIGLPDAERGRRWAMWDQPEVHEVYRRWRKVLDSYDGERMAVAEAWTDSPESTARYIRHDELQQAFNFHWLSAAWSAAAFRKVVTESLDAVGLVGGTATWVLSNHDVVRHVSRYGGGRTGLDRARAAMLTMMALPGSAYVYQGEELGLEQVDVAPEHRQDPSYLRTGEAGRDGCRVPIPWSGTSAPFGFGPGDDQPWLPQPEWFERAHHRGAAGRPGLDAVVLPGGAGTATQGRARPRPRGHDPRDSARQPGVPARAGRGRSGLRGQLRVADGAAPGRGGRAADQQRRAGARRTAGAEHRRLVPPGLQSAPLEVTSPGCGCTWPAARRAR